MVVVMAVVVVMVMVVDPGSGPAQGPKPTPVSAHEVVRALQSRLYREAAVYSHVAHSPDSRGRAKHHRR